MTSLRRQEVGNKATAPAAGTTYDFALVVDTESFRLEPQIRRSHRLLSSSALGEHKGFCSSETIPECHQVYKLPWQVTQPPLIHWHVYSNTRSNDRDSGIVGIVEAENGRHRPGT